MRVIPVAPTGVRRAGQNPHTGLWGYERPVYPRSRQGEYLRELRVYRGAFMSTYRAAQACGLHLVEFEDVECGRATLTPADWKTLYDAVKAAKTAARPRRMR